jgi:hypothetical protein
VQKPGCLSIDPGALQMEALVLALGSGQHSHQSERPRLIRGTFVGYKISIVQRNFGLSIYELSIF